MSPPAQHAIGHALIRRSIDLRCLYRRAAMACEPGLRMVLNDNVQTLDVLILELQAQPCLVGEPHVRGSWRGAARCRLTDWLVRAADRGDAAWVRVLAHHEYALLQTFEQALATAPAASAQLLRRQLARLHGIHLDMHSLGGSAHY